MRKAALSAALLLVLVISARHAAAFPEKSAAKLEVTYYYLPG